METEVKGNSVVHDALIMLLIGWEPWIVEYEEYCLECSVRPILQYQQE